VFERCTKQAKKTK